MISNRRLAALSTAAVLALSACGGGGDGASPFTADDTALDEVTETAVDTPTTAPATTAPPTTAAPTTAPATTAPPTTAPPTTTPPTTAAPVTAPPTTAAPAALGVQAEYCDDVEVLYVSGEALDIIDLNDPPIFRRGYLLVAVQVGPLLETAPTVQDAQLVDQLRLHLVDSTPLINIDFDINRAGELDDSAAVGEALIGVSSTVDEIGRYLIDVCGSDPVELSALSREVADEVSNDIAAEPAGPSTTTTTTIAPAAGEVPAGFVAVENESGLLIANVPSAWGDVDGSPDGDLERLTIATNIDAFLASYTEPGMLLLSGDSGSPDAWRDAIGGFVEFAQDDGCIVVDSSDYDDGLYTGLEHVLDCGTSLATTHLIGGRNEEGTKFFLLAIVRPSDSPVVRDEIVRSFFID